MAAVWSVLLTLTGRPEALFWFHLLLMVAWVLAWARLLRSAGFGWTGLILLTLGVASPSILNFAGVLWKDVALGFAMSAATAAAATLYLSEPRGGAGSTIGRWLILAVMALCLIYATGVRANGLPAAIPVIALAVLAVAPAGWSFWKRGGTAILAGLGGAVLLALANNFLAYAVIGAEKEHPEQYIQLYDLTGIGMRTGHFAIPDQYKTGDYSDEFAREAYRTYSGNYLFFPEVHPIQIQDAQSLSTTEGLSDLRQAWLHEIYANPMAYLQHRLDAFFSLLRIGHDSSYFPMLPFSTKPVEGTRLPGEIAASNMLTGYITWTMERSPVFHGWVWGVALLASVFGGVAYRRHAIGLVVVTLGTSGLLYLLPYFVLGPASDFRYLYWSVIAATLGLVILGCLAIRSIRYRVQTRLPAASLQDGRSGSAAAS